MADDNDDKNVDPPADPPADPPRVDPPPPPPQHDDDLRNAVTALTETVTGLVQKVEQMTERAQDESPVNKPWTHRSLG